MKIAIIGSGIAGLGIAAHLIEDHELTIFYDKKGASYASSGLIHKFTGDTGLKSYMADDAYKQSVELIVSLKGDFASSTSIKRCLLNELMRTNFIEAKSDDVELIDQDHVLIKQATVIDVPRYLEALRVFLENAGCVFVQEKIQDIKNLQGFDLIVVAAGFGIKELSPCLKMKFLKGQSLIFSNNQEYQKPLIAKGYLVPFKDWTVIGSTYEKVFDSDEVDIYTAYKYLKDHLKNYYHPYDEKTPWGAVSGVRVAHPNCNHPVIIKTQKNILVVTGLGSRGLLYHGYLGGLINQYIKTGVMTTPFFK
jgi:glycine/D-amino acid oxidase-like deaminating enzyme